MLDMYRERKMIALGTKLRPDARSHINFEELLDGYASPYSYEYDPNLEYGK